MSYADLNQCKGCACFVNARQGGLVNGLCLDCRNPEVETCEDCGRPIYWDAQAGDFRHVTEPERGCFLISAQGYADRPHGDSASAYGCDKSRVRTPQQEQELDVMRSRGEL